MKWIPGLKRSTILTALIVQLLIMLGSVAVAAERPNNLLDQAR